MAETDSIPSAALAHRNSLSAIHETSINEEQDYIDHQQDEDDIKEEQEEHDENVEKEEEDNDDNKQDLRETVVEATDVVQTTPDVHTQPQHQQQQHVSLFSRGKGAAEVAYETYLDEINQWKQKHQQEEMLKAKLKQKASKNANKSKTKKADAEDYSSSDSDLEDVKLSSTRYFRNESLDYIYNAACKRFKIVPYSQFRYQLRQNNIMMTNLSLNSIDISAMSVAISRNENITSIDFSGNCMGYQGLKNLMLVIGNCSRLQSLNLSQNKLGSKAAKYFVDYNDNLRTLRYLNISENNFIEKDSDCLCYLLQPETLESLRHLDMSNNTFGCYGGEVFGPLIAKNNTLEILNLSWCDIRMNGAVMIGLALKENGSLDVLDISHNGFGDAGAKAIAEALKTNQALSVLNLSSNRIFVEGAMALGAMLGVNESLKELDLDQNCFTCEGAEEILSKLKTNENSKLTKIDMKNVSLTYKTAAAVLPTVQHPLLLRCDSFLLGAGRLKNQLDIPANSEGRTLMQRLEASATAIASVFIKNQRVDILRLAKEVAGYSHSKNTFSEEEMRAIIKAMPIELDETELTQLVEMLPKNEDGTFDIRSLLEFGEPSLGKLVTSH